MKRLFLFLMILGAAALLAAGCSDDDPVQPDPEPLPVPVATTPDSLMALYRIAVEDMDADLYGQLLTPDFRMAVSAWEGNFPDLLTDHMTKDEVLTAAANMFGGQSIMNWEGDSVPAVDRMTIHEWEQVTDWAAKDGSGTLVPGTVSSLWSIRLFVERGTSYPILAVAGLYMVEVQPQPTPGGDGSRYAMTAMELVPDGKSETFGWAGAHLVYLTNEAPTAVLEMTEEATEPWSTYFFDPAGSSDDDSGLADLPYRWNMAGGFILKPEEWSDWTDQPLAIEFRESGDHTVTLEVRDRWGGTARVEKTATVTLSPLPFAGSPDQLVENIRIAYEQLAAEHLLESTHDHFTMVLQQGTIERYPNVGTTLDSFEEMAIHQRMFSGREFTNSQEEVLPAVTAVEFQTLTRLTDWEETMGFPFQGTQMANYDVDIRIERGPMESVLRTRGQIRFHVMARDSLYQGETRSYYEMAGQLDLTVQGKALEEVYFGSLKAMYW